MDPSRRTTSTPMYSLAHHPSSSVIPPYKPSRLGGLAADPHSSPHVHPSPRGPLDPSMFSPDALGGSRAPSHPFQPAGPPPAGRTGSLQGTMSAGVYDLHFLKAMAAQLQKTPSLPTSEHSSEHLADAPAPTRRGMQLNRTPSKCDLSIVAPRPMWGQQQPHAAQAGGAAMPAQSPADPCRPRLARYLSKDDMHVSAGRAADAAGMPPAYHPAPHTASRIQSAGGVTRGGGTPRGAGGAGGAVGAPAMQGSGPMSPGGGGRSAAIAGKGNPGVMCEKGMPSPGGGPKGPKSKARALARMASKDDMYVEVLSKQWKGPLPPNSPRPRPAPAHTPTQHSPRPAPMNLGFSNSPRTPRTPGTAGSVGPMPPLMMPAGCGGVKKLERSMSDDSIAEERNLAVFHKQRLQGKAKGPTGAVQGKKAAAGKVAATTSKAATPGASRGVRRIVTSNK